MTTDFKEIFKFRENFNNVLTELIRNYVDSEADEADVRNITEELLTDGWVTDD